MRGSSFKSFLIAVAAIGLACPVTSRAALITFRDGLNGYAGTVDTHLRQASPTTDASAAVFLQADMSDGGLPQHALIRFDNIVGANPGQIPANQTVNSATLVIRSTTANAQSGGTISFHRILIPWNETDTWTGSFGDNGVQADDVEAMSVADGSYLPNFADPGGNPVNTRERTLDVTAAVQAWVNGGVNYGWVLLNSSTDGYRFDSSENGIATNNPAIIVDYGSPEPAMVTTDPVNATVVERGTVSFAVTATGSLPISYQWFNGATMLTDGTACVNGNDRVVSGATTPTLTIANVQLTDAGMYHCEVSNTAPPPDSSADATLTVTPDTTPPTVLYAICGSNPNELVLAFSEPMNDSCQVIGSGSVTDPFSWIIQDIGGMSLTVAGFTNMGSFAGQTVLGITTGLPHDPTKPVQISWTAEFYDTSAGQNALPAGSVMALCYTNPVVVVPTNQIYKVEDTGTSLDAANPPFYAVAYDDSGWTKSGPGIFESERQAPPPHCRAVTDRGLQVGTCITISNLIANVNIPTTYFRTHFNYSGSPAGKVFVLEAAIDDGVIIYLNGTEIGRYQMPAGPAVYATFANATTGDGGFDTHLVAPVGGILVSGDNTLAAELHNVNATSSDLMFGLKIFELATTPPIVLAITQDSIGGTVTISWNGGGTLRSTTSITTPRPWPAVAGATSPYTIPNTGTQVFYEVSDP
jgi:hypothetical protein